MLRWGQTSWGGGVWAGSSVPSFDALGLAVLLGLSLVVALFLIDRSIRTRRQEKAR